MTHKIHDSQFQWLRRNYYRGDVGLNQISKKGLACAKENTKFTNTFSKLNKNGDVTVYHIYIVKHTFLENRVAVLVYSCIQIIET